MPTVAKRPGGAAKAAASSSGNQRTGGQILVDCLRTHGVERAFCVPGESYIAALDALHDAPEIDLIVCRHESGAAMMADAYGKMTGKPGICFVTRGPGATNASSGVHIAYQDSTPMILIIGQVARRMLDREAFQEIDYRRMFGQMAKWVAQIDDTARIPEYVSRAFHTATSGRPGPVVLAIPEDVFRERAFAKEARAFVRPVTHPGAVDMERLRTLLGEARTPSSSWGAAVGPQRPAPTSARSSKATGCRSAPPSAARIISTTPMPTTSATSASASTRSSRRASGKPTS
jgi:acetolactate synthase-1/2/3 large subunit